MDLLIPGDEWGPGAGEAGAADYVDRLLGAFAFDPPRIWAGGPYSGRHGGAPGFDAVARARPGRGAGLAHPHRGHPGRSARGSSTVR